MDMNQIMRQIQGMNGGMGGPQVDQPVMDTAEQVEISSLALLKMLKHGELRDPLCFPRPEPSALFPCSASSPKLR